MQHRSQADRRFIAKRWNRRPRRGFKGVMIPTKLERIAARAARLRHEARNCLTLAVATRDTALAAQLIDEAARLRRRSDELASAAS